MTGNVRDVIKLVAGLVLTLLLIGIVFAIFRTGRSTADSAQSELSSFNTTLMESKYTEYEGRTILGNEVVSFLTTNANSEIAIQVITSSGSNKIYNYSSIDMSGAATDAEANNTAISAAKKKGDATYINPNGKFECTLNRDANSTITGIIFTQQ